MGEALSVGFDGRQAWLVAASRQTVLASKVQAHRGHDTGKLTHEAWPFSDCAFSGHKRHHRSSELPHAHSLIIEVPRAVSLACLKCFIHILDTSAYFSQYSNSGT